MIIYRATAPSGKAYIGQTISTLARRRKQHECDARRGSDFPFHRAIRKYGKAIKWEVIAKADSIAALNALEAMYIALCNTLSPNGYNAKTGGENSVHCAEARAKISATMKAKRKEISAKLKARYAAWTDEERLAWTANISAGAKAGIAAMTDEARAAMQAKLSAVRKGKKFSPEARANMAAAQIGRVMSPEARANMAAAAKAAWAARVDRTFSPEHRAKLSAARKGKTISPKHRAAISAANKVRWDRWRAERLSQ